MVKRVRAEDQVEARIGERQPLGRGAGNGEPRIGGRDGHHRLRWIDAVQPRGRKAICRQPQ